MAARSWSDSAVCLQEGRNGFATAGKGNVVNGTFTTPGLDVALLRVAGDRCARQTPFSQFLRLSLGRAGWEGAIEPSSFSFCWCCWSLRSSCCFVSFSSQTGFSPSPVPESRVVLVTMLSLVNSHCQLLLHQKTLWSLICSPPIRFPSAWRTSLPYGVPHTSIPQGLFHFP